MHTSIGTTSITKILRHSLQSSSFWQQKDKCSNCWFSENHLLESLVIKSIMSGCSNVFLILWYLHCCSNIDKQPVGETMTPSITRPQPEVRDYFEDRYNWLFVPGQQLLSLDEMLLIHAFGRIKFKVRIATKVAWWYTESRCMSSLMQWWLPFFQLWFTHEKQHITWLRMARRNWKQFRLWINWSNHLLAPTSHRTIYIDQFYTSLDKL